MNGKCALCGDTARTFPGWFKGAVLLTCESAPECGKRIKEQTESDAWYETMVDRMKERAPA